MVSEIIESKKQVLNQKINKLKQQEAKLKEAERKSRNRKLFEKGGLVEKAELSHLSSNQLYGALLQIKKQSENSVTLKEWEHIGGAAFHNESKEKGDAVIVTFPEKPSLEIRKQLREFGLKWNSFREEWQGICVINEIDGFIKNNNGNLSLINSKAASQ